MASISLLVFIHFEKRVFTPDSWVYFPFIIILSPSQPNHTFYLFHFPQKWNPFLYPNHFTLTFTQKKLNQIINKFPQKISSAPVPHSKSTTICYEACFISIITLPITTYIMFTYVSKKVYPLKLLFFCCLLQTAYLLYFQISPRLIF